MINRNKFVVVIQEEDPHIESEEKSVEKMENEKNNVVKEPHEILETKEPPFLERFLVNKTKTTIEYDLESKLRNVIINIP